MQEMTDAAVVGRAAGGPPPDALEDKIRASGRHISVIRSEDDAIRFWAAPARAKIVLFYWSGCHWCKVWVPEFIRIGPPTASSDVMVAAVERAYMRPMLVLSGLSPSFGFPHTVLFTPSSAPGQQRSGFTLRHVFRSRQAEAFAAELLSVMPELASAPSLAYLTRLEGSNRGGAAPDPNVALRPPCPTAPCPVQRAAGVPMRNALSPTRSMSAHPFLQKAAGASVTPPAPPQPAVNAVASSQPAAVPPPQRVPNAIPPRPAERTLNPPSLAHGGAGSIPCPGAAAATAGPCVGFGHKSAPQLVKGRERHSHRTAGGGSSSSSSRARRNGGGVGTSSARPARQAGHQEQSSYCVIL